MNTFETSADTGTGTDGKGGVRVVNLERAPLKELLLKETSRSCNNIPMIVFFWGHILGMCILITYVMTSDTVGSDGLDGAVETIVNFLAGSDTGRNLFGVMIGTCITGGVFATCWIYFLRFFKDNSIKVSIIVAHLIVLGFVIWAIVDNVIFFAIFYGVGLLLIDIWLYCNRQDFAFAEVMMKVGTTCVAQNPQMQCFAYAFMPLQIITYIFWLMGLLYTMAFDWGQDNWYIIYILFLFSYNWAGWFWHLIVHSFVSVLTAFWALGMDGGYDKATQSCKASMTFSQGPIAIGSFIMAILSVLKFMIKWSMRSVCCCCGDCVYKFCCKCLERVIQRYNEYVLAIVNLFDLAFFDASSTLVSLFQRTGMSFVTNEVAWSVPISVGTFCGYCISGGMGLAYHKAAFQDSDILNNKMFDTAFFFLYGFLGGSVTSIGLAPLRSVLTSVFVIWSEEPRSFAAGQPSLYGDLLVAVEKSPGVKSALDQCLLDGNKQVDV